METTDAKFPHKLSKLAMYKQNSTTEIEEVEAPMVTLPSTTKVKKPQYHPARPTSKRKQTLAT